MKNKENIHQENSYKYRNQWKLCFRKSSLYKMLNTEPESESVYIITVEEYLKPKKTHKLTKLILTKNKIEPISKQLKLSEDVHKKHINAFERNSKSKKNIKECIKDVRNKFINFMPQKLRKAGNLLKRCVNFLLARNDDEFCKRKSGFEIYCEMASIHGFHNFVGAKTWQRTLWWFVICLSLLTSIFFGLHMKNRERLLTYYIESMTHPAYTMPFPAVTICNVNRISKAALENIAKDFDGNLNATSLGRLLWLHQMPKDTPYDKDALAALIANTKLSWTRLLSTIAPSCENQLLHCKWKGFAMNCSELFKRSVTPNGLCCSFNYNAWSDEQPEYTASCSAKTGLTVWLQPQLDDYAGAFTMTPGFEIIIHGSSSFPDYNAKRILIPTDRANSINVAPHDVKTAANVRAQEFWQRRCYLQNERRLQFFRNYTQINCLAECRSQKWFNKCGCVPPFEATNGNLPVCNFDKIECLQKYKNFGAQLLEIGPTQTTKINRNDERFVCDCFQHCSSYNYEFGTDSGALVEFYPNGNNEDFKNLTLLHVFYGELDGEQLVLDIYENWLTTLANMGGITGMFVGCSFISIFELIFFVLVRPACNWMTKQRIRYRIKRHQKKKIEAAKANNRH